MDNLTIFTNEYNDLKGQMVISSDKVYRFIGLAEDEHDYYYVLYDGRKISLHTCVGSIVPLKGYIREKDYLEMIRIAKLNHYDQATLWANREPEKARDFSEQHKKEVTAWEEGTQFIQGPCWDLN
jgi:hypothetical protein